MPAKTTSGRAVRVPSGRISRLARFGSLTTSIMGSVAYSGALELSRGRRPGLRDLVMTPANLHRLTNELARMRGAAMKIGQLISMDAGEVLPSELAEILGRLRADADFMPPSQLKQRLDSNWRSDWLREFKHFNVRPIAAASIGQVHRAQLRDGRSLAVKVQYPGVARSIDSDVSNVGSLLKISGLLPGGFDVAPYLEEAKRQLHEETDYLREGYHLARFNARLSGSDDFEVPVFHEDWSTEAILSMSFAEGDAIESLEDATQGERDRVATRLIDLTLRELFEFNEIQSDPNFANYLYNPKSGRIVLLDFGATRSLDWALVRLYRRLMAAGLKGDGDRLRGAASELGFVSPEMRPDHRRRVFAMMELVFATLRDAPVYDFADKDLSRQMQEEGMALAEEDFVPPPVPMDVLYLQRKIGGLFLLASRLRARVPLRDLLERYLVPDTCDVSPAALATG